MERYTYEMSANIDQCDMTAKLVQPLVHIERRTGLANCPAVAINGIVFRERQVFSVQSWAC